MTIFYVMIGGGLGAMLRALLSHVINKWADSTFPFATLMVNLIGCFFFGLLIPTLTSESAYFHFLIVGMLGGFTTFSTVQLELSSLIQRQKWLQLWQLLVLQYMGCFISLMAGYALTYYGIM